MARPRKDAFVNYDIDQAIKKMMRSLDDLPPDVKLNTIKTAIMWEKVKHSIKEDDAGAFFNDDKGDTDGTE